MVKTPKTEPKETKKTKTILIRVSPAEYETINDAAWGTRKRLSQFVRDAAVEAAGKTKKGK